VGALISKRGPNSQRGALMIEVLVTIVVVVIGVLGLMEMHSRLQLSEMESYQRSQAVMLVNDMASRISTNRYNALKYATDSALVGYGVNCASIGNADIAADDSTEWCLALQGASETDDSSGSVVNVGAMLGGRGCVTAEDANTLFRVTVVWQGLVPVSAPPVEVTCGANLYDNADAKCTDDKCRRYVTTLVRVAAL
jgi:type IV pilus assembly protein PilV